MADGKPRSVKKMAEELGCTEVQAHDALHYVRKHKATRSLDTHYEITPQGRLFLHHRELRLPKSKLPMPEGGIVSTAIRQQTGLGQVWR
jgi:hypothetical protein